VGGEGGTYITDKKIFGTVSYIAGCGVQVEFAGTNAQRNVAVFCGHV